MGFKAGLAAGLLCWSGFGALAAETAAPLSAIDWLSDSLTEEAVLAPEAAPPAANTPPEIRVLPLDAPVPDTAGLIDAAALGLPADLWGRSAAGDLARELTLLEIGADAPPSIPAFLADLLQARLDPPIDAAIDDRFFLARVDRLLAMGHLETAKRLIAAAGPIEPRRFRRAFDIALLTGAETEACRTIEETPELSPTYPARIFCLARLGQWDVAALTLGNAETLGILNPEEEELLLHFLDPELFEGEPVPPVPPTPTPLQFRLFEAVGERLPTDGLPVAFAAADLSDTVGWKARLRAAERLAASGAMPFTTMLEIHAERDPAASGGIWERVAALQALLDAVETGAGEALNEALPPAWAAAREAGYERGFAEWIVPHLAGAPLVGPAAHAAVSIALLADAPEIAAEYAAATPEDRFLLALARGETAPPPPGDVLGRAVIEGLAAPRAGQDALIAEDRRGEALLRALAQLADGAGGNPGVTAQSLATLRRLGLDDLARRVAVELVLLEGTA